MLPLNNLILSIIFLTLSACAAGNAVAPVVVDVVPPRPASQPAKILTIPETGPEQSLRAIREAYQARDGETVLLLAQHVVEHYPDTPLYKRSLFLMEQALIQLDRASEADAAMLRVKAEYPELADYAVFILAEYHYAKARYTQAAALYQHLTETYSKSSLVTRSLFRRAQALLESYAYLQAAEAFEQFLQDNPRSELAPAAGMGLGRALTAEASLAQAVRAYQNVWIRYPGNPNDLDVEKALAELKAGGVEIPEPLPAELYERGMILSRSNQHEKALESFVKLLEKEPDSPNRPEVMLRTGIAAFYLNRRGEAAVVLEKMVKDYPTDQRTPEALYWLGKAYSRLGDWERGIKTFQKILDRYPDSEWADDALFLIGNIHRETGDVKKALLVYRRLAEEYPESKFADSSIWWRAWSHYTAGDYKKSEQVLQELVNRRPRSFLVNQAWYWQGRAAEKRGDLSKAVSYYEQVLKKGPFTYYGYRAAERITAIETSSGPVEKIGVSADSIVLCGEVLCTDDPAPSCDTDNGPPVWTEETRQLLAAEPSFRKALELMHLDMKKEAAAELSYLQESMPRRPGMLIGLSKAFFELGDYHRSIMLVLRNYERYLEGSLSNTPEDLWRLAYPQGYWESILSYARQYNQDPYFIAAIIREESQFHAEALSPAGAQGLMQVMPATGEREAQLIKLRGFDRSKLFDSDVGINIGTSYLGHLMKRFKGDTLLVAASYNAGPEAVISWISKNGYGKDRDVFVESIPFAETRGYVKKVLRNYAEYKRIYGRNARSVDPGLRIEGMAN